MGERVPRKTLDTYAESRTHTMEECKEKVPQDMGQIYG
jgi:hypothetical protein